MQDRPARVNILGVGISAIALDKAVQRISTWIDHGARHYVTALYIRLWSAIRTRNCNIL